MPLFAIAASDSLILLFADIIGSHSNSLALLGAFTRIIHGKDVVKSEAAAELLAVYAMEHAALHAALQSDAAELYAAKLEAFVTLLSHNNESSTAKLALFELCLDSCAGDSKLQIELLVQLNDELLLVARADNPGGTRGSHRTPLHPFRTPDILAGITKTH